MFKSIEFVKNIFENQSRSFVFKIIDDNFEEKWINTLHPGSIGMAKAVIDCYSSKNFNVAINLILLMRYFQEKYDYPIAEQISWYQEYTSEFEKYLTEIQKYINLL